MTRYLEPLAVAANITQGSFCHMDQVLVTFGFMSMIYHSDDMKHDMTGQQAILNSIDAHWAKSDQRVFIAAVLVNPCYRTRLFAHHPRFNLSQIKTLFARLFVRFFNAYPKEIFFTHLEDFFNGRGIFMGIDQAVEGILTQAHSQVGYLQCFSDTVQSHTNYFW